MAERPEGYLGREGSKEIFVAKQINVGLWARNGWKNPNDDLGARIGELEQAIDTAFDTIAPGVPAPAGGPHLSTLHVFVAPEYLFKRNFRDCAASNTITAYSEQDKDHILAELSRISQSRANFLLVPGSIFWHRILPKKHILARKKPPQIFNTTYAFHDGKCLFAYDKMNDCGELSHEIPAESKKCSFVAGTTFGLFDCDDLRVGIETCLDHDKGMLKKNGEQVDLHIIASNTVTFTTSHGVAKPTGFVLHANAIQINIGNQIYRHPFAHADNLKLTSQGMVSFGRVAI